MSEALGQILPDSVFGSMLTELAKRSDVIVEVGTWRGLGSTLCLANGLICSGQVLITIDAGKDKVEEAAGRYSDKRITFLHGRICPIERLLPKEHPNAETLEYYDGEKDALVTAPDVLRKIPEVIDLLMLDGGEWSTQGDFEVLMPRARIIAIDDTNQAKCEKGWRARKTLIEQGWNVIADVQDSRNGFFIAERKA